VPPLSLAHHQRIHFTGDNCDKRHSKVDWFFACLLKLEMPQNVTDVTDDLGSVHPRLRGGFADWAKEKHI
jgi:hypothetical protein